MIRPHRSLLYIPGSNARALEKGKSLAADALIFDLEDAVAPEAKEAARDRVAAAVRSGGYGARDLVIRVNDLSTPWGKDDFAAAAAACPHAVLLPKVATPGDIMIAAKELRDNGAPDGVALWAMIETPLGIVNAAAIASTAADPSSRLAAFVIGTNDLVKATRARPVPGRAPLLAALSACVLAARAYGIEVFDGVFDDIANQSGLRSECLQGRDFGMDGKTLIHPAQIAVCNEIFTPTHDDVTWAKKIIAAFALPANAGLSAIALDGRMVERLHADIARRTVSMAEAAARLES